MWWSRLADLLFPKTCLGCNQPGAWLCASCRQRLPRYRAAQCFFCQQPAVAGKSCGACQTTTSIDGVIAAVPYADPTIRRVIQVFKYHPAKELATDVAEVVLSALAHNSFIPDIDVIVPIPLHAKRQRWRGFNQSLVLAEHLEQRLGRPVCQAVVRDRFTRAQARLSTADRQANVAGAFRVVEPDVVKNRHVLLVDDVITTGATTAAVAQIVKAAGAKTVWVVAIAAG